MGYGAFYVICPRASLQSICDATDCSSVIISNELRRSRVACPIICSSACYLLFHEIFSVRSTWGHTGAICPVCSECSYLLCFLKSMPP